jgi:hypothetical protein
MYITNLPVPFLSDITASQDGENGGIQETQETTDAPRRVVQNEIDTYPPSAKTPDTTYGFGFQRDPEPDSASIGPSEPSQPCARYQIGIQECLNRNTQKAGLCVICWCENPRDGKRIENCTAAERMETCFGKKLGYLTIKVGPNMSFRDLDNLMQELSTLCIPEACSKDFRFLLSFLGHGSNDQICLADCKVGCLEIISRVQKMIPAHAKIMLFDSCRTEGYPHQPIQVSNSSLTKHANTLVIYATDYNCEAFYDDGCGLVTHSLTKFAPSLNESISEVLTHVRVVVDQRIESLKPACTQNVPSFQIVVCENRLMETVRLLAESRGTARVCPSISSVMPSVFSIYVGWHIDHHVESRIQSSYTTVKAEGESSVFRVAQKVKGLAKINRSSLQPNVNYCVKLVTVYEDGVIAESEGKSFMNKELNCATVSSVHLMELSPITLDVQWVIDTDLAIDLFTVLVIANEEVVFEKKCRGKRTELQLQPGTKYSLIIKTCYSVGIQSASDEYHYTTPTEDEMKPGVECSEENQNSVTVVITDPPLFLRREEFNVALELADRFRVTCTPLAAEKKNSGRYKNQVFDRDTATTTHQIELAGLRPDTDYKVDCEMDCLSSGDVSKNGAIFTSAKASWLQRCCSSVYWIILLYLLLFGGLAVSYMPYHKYLQGNEGCTTFYTLTDAVVQCGGANSLQYEGVTVEGSFQGGDTLTGTFSTWLVREDNVTFSSQTQGPFPDGYPLSGGDYVTLYGWKTYVWRGSIISGFSCVQNQNNIDQNATLHLFYDDQDMAHFKDTGIARNFILSETITIPANDQNCFRKWGKDAPFNVTKNAYHYFVLNVSSDNMNFTSEITVFQKSVNVSNYSDPQYFNYNNQTYFSFPNGITHPTEYITICRAPGPDYLTSNISKPDATSLHIQSCAKPHVWLKPSFGLVTAVGSVCFIGLVVVTVRLCIRNYKSQRKRKREKSQEERRSGYTRILSSDSLRPYGDL